MLCRKLPDRVTIKADIVLSLTAEPDLYLTILGFHFVNAQLIQSCCVPLLKVGSCTRSLIDVGAEKCFPLTM